MFAGWLLNPWLLGAGAILVASPIIIHLLNKRRFRIVDWAAMDFLLEADQRNRRRIQLEEMLLLALRCLAVLLTGLLVARPFLPSSLTQNWFASTRTERIVLLDDSPSMDASEAGGSPFQKARDQLRDFVTALSESGTGDSLTLVLTSRPTRPVFADVAVNEHTTGAILGDLDALAVSDLASRLDAACLELRGLVSGRSDKINRVVYVLSDLRRGDWVGNDSPQPDDEKQDESVTESLRELAANAAGCFVVDLSESTSNNLAVIGVVPDGKSLLSGVTTRFNITVKNHGSQSLRDVPVRFLSGGSLPMTATIDAVPAGGTASVPFSYTFASFDSTTGSEPEPVEVTADLGTAPQGDSLPADNTAYYAARVRAGIPTLIVDGDASTEYGKAETFFLQRALAPPGVVGSGILPDVVSDSEFESRSLGPYQVVYLCNVYHLSEARRQSLEEWVKGGGGLVLWPGGQVDDRYYNEQLFASGKGLLPAPLDRIAGDETEKTWASFSVDAPDHPAVKVFFGDASPLLENAKIFQWQHVDRQQLPTGATVVMSLTDSDRSPAMIDRPFGRGRVIQINVPADVDWSNWPEDASYLIVLQELNRYLARSVEDRGQRMTGQPFEEPVDLARFETSVSITRPDGESVTRQATRRGSESAEASAGASTDWSVQYDEADVRGFYRMKKTTRDGAAETTLFAANLDPEEGNLKRVEHEVLARAWEGSNVQIANENDLASLTAEGAKGELWKSVLMTLIGILFLEQTLAWLFGRRR